MKIPYESLNVDRWSVITSFWDNFFKNDYVYFAKSNVGNPPGPMPFYFILALPFYFIGELGYFSILGIVVFLLLLRYNSRSNAVQSTYIILILFSVFYLWEVICRSNVFLNGTLILFSIVYLFKSLENNKRHYLLSNGIIIGLLLSTRNVFVIPYIVAFLFALKYQFVSIKDTLQIGLIAFILFILTFVPFVYNHLEDFKVMNPFKIQSSSLMPLEYCLACIALSFGTILIVKQKSDVYFYSGLILFVTIVFYYVYLIKEYNFEDAFFNSQADISYFILCIPFILYYMVENENKIV
jgi:hypothetical protein